MSQPPSPYERSYSFTDNSTANPTSQQPGNKIDQELNAARTAINATISRLGEVQADDGKVRNSALNLTTIAQAVEPLLTTGPLTSVNAAGAAQVTAVNAAGTTQVSAVNAAGTANLASLNALINSTNATNAANAAAAAAYSANQALNSKNDAAYWATAALTEAGNSGASAAASEVSRVNAFNLAVEASFHSSSAQSASDLAQLAYAQASGSAMDAQASKMAALEAKGDAENAAASAQNAVNNAGAIIVGDVQSLVDEAESFAAQSSSSATQSHNSANDALTAKTNAQAAATAAAGSASSASSSASAASGSASAASASAAAAAASAASVTVTEAPINGNEYVRKNGAWSVNSVNSGGIPEAPTNGQQYARQSGGWAVVTPPASYPADSLTAVQVGSITNASYTNVGAGGQVSFNTPNGQLLFTDSNMGGPSKSLTVSSASSWNLVNYGSYWQLDVPTYSNTSNYYYAEDVANYVNGQGVSLTCQTTAPYGTDQTDSFVSGTSYTLAYTQHIIDASDQLMMKDGLRAYLRDTAMAASASAGMVPTFDGNTVNWGSPWQSEGYVNYGYIGNYYTKLQSDALYPKINGGNTFTAGVQIFAASQATYASIRIPHGATPTTLVDGDTWTTTGGLFWRQNGATKQAMNLGDTQTVSGSITFSNTNLTFGSANGGSTTNIATGPTNAATSKTVNIGTNGVVNSTTLTNIGPAVGLSTTTIGPTTAASTLNLATGATLTATTKAVNIGTNGVAGSTTNITIGSTTGNSTTTLQGITNGVTQTAGDSSTKLATTAFVTAAIPAYAAIADTNIPSVTNKVMSPKNVLDMLMFPGYQEYTNGGVTGTSGAGAGVSLVSRLRQFVGPNVSTAGYAYNVIDTTGAAWGFFGSKRGDGDFRKNFARKFWVSGRSAIGNSNANNYVGDANNLYRVELGGRLTPSAGDATTQGIGWKLAGGGSSAIVFYMRTRAAANGGTYSQVTSSFTPASYNWFDWTIYYDGSANAYLYVNDTQVATIAASFTGYQEQYNFYTEQVEQTASAAVQMMAWQMPTRVYFSE